MIGFREKVVTDGLTYERTAMGQSIGPTSKVGGSKNQKNLTDGAGYIRTRGES